MSPRDAGQATAEQHFQAFTHMYTAQLSVPGPGLIARMYKASRIMYFEQGRSESFRPRDLVPDHGPHPRWTTWCLTQSREAEIAVLDMTLPAYARATGLRGRRRIVGLSPPAAWGQETFGCARGAAPVDQVSYDQLGILTNGGRSIGRRSPASQRPGNPKIAAERRTSRFYLTGRAQH